MGISGGHCIVFSFYLSLSFSPAKVRSGSFFFCPLNTQDSLNVLIGKKEQANDSALWFIL